MSTNCSLSDSAQFATDMPKFRKFHRANVANPTRRYARSLEPLPSELEVCGVGKRAVSERFVVGTARKLAELMRRNLNGLRLVAMLVTAPR